jgi:hypothetical protein
MTTCASQLLFNSHLIFLCVPEPVDHPLGVVVEDAVVEVLLRVAGVDAQGYSGIVERDV